MPEIVSLNEELMIIEVQSIGDISESEMEASLERITKLSHEHRVYRVLIDAQQETSLPDIGWLYEFVKSVPKRLKYDMLVPADSPTSNDKEFIETAASNRGLSMRNFQSREDAIAWLSGIES